MPGAVAATCGAGCRKPKAESRKASTRVAHLKCYERVTTGRGLDRSRDRTYTYL
nr:MAG TPA: hypothetical protein [Caudoviricetes sp.]